MKTVLSSLGSSDAPSNEALSLATISAFIERFAARAASSMRCLRSGIILSPNGAMLPTFNLSGFFALIATRCSNSALDGNANTVQL